MIFTDSELLRQWTWAVTEPVFVVVRLLLWPFVHALTLLTSTAFGRPFHNDEFSVPFFAFASLNLASRLLHAATQW